MGQTTSNIAKKLVSPLYHGWKGSVQEGDDSNTAVAVSRFGNPFIFTRRGSMYFDEDGDLAHEFYEEVSYDRRGQRTQMRRLRKNLVPEGDVELPYPRLHVDFPVVLCEAPTR